MSEKTKRKTLANCKLSEFTAQANKIRKQVYDFYHAINMDGITKEFAEKCKGVDASDREKVSSEFIGKIFDVMMTEHPVETVEIIASLAFLTFDEAEELEPSEALEIVVECAFSQKVIDFFINAERLAGNGTDGILLPLIFLKSIILEMNTSDSKSQDSTNNMKESASALSTPVNA